MVGLVRYEEGDYWEGLRVPQEDPVGDEGLEVGLKATPPAVQEGRV